MHISQYFGNLLVILNKLQYYLHLNNNIMSSAHLGKIIKNRRKELGISQDDTE